jgi:cell fate regulator YaaT (PSP1 superfamily)
MCCLKYEHPMYQDAAENWPADGTEVQTAEGPGRVVGRNVPGEKLVVRLSADGRRTTCPVASTCGSRQLFESRATS